MTSTTSFKLADKDTVVDDVWLIFIVINSHTKVLENKLAVSVPSEAFGWFKGRNKNSYEKLVSLRRICVDVTWTASNMWPSALANTQIRIERSGAATQLVFALRTEVVFE